MVNLTLSAFLTINLSLKKINLSLKKISLFFPLFKSCENTIEFFFCYLSKWEHKNYIWSAFYRYRSLANYDNIFFWRALLKGIITKEGKNVFLIFVILRVRISPSKTSLCFILKYCTSVIGPQDGRIILLRKKIQFAPSVNSKVVLFIYFSEHNYPFTFNVIYK